MRPRCRGVLYSNFCLPVNSPDLYGDGKGVLKIFYDRLLQNGPKTPDLVDKHIIYIFFYEYFKNSSIFLFICDGNKYEIKYFDEVDICDSRKEGAEFRSVLKVGYRKSNKIVSDKGHINDHYLRRIIQMLNDNCIGVNIMSYEISYIGG
jgi:hypothetical protein